MLLHVSGWRNSNTALRIEPHRVAIFYASEVNPTWIAEAMGSALDTCTNKSPRLSSRLPPLSRVLASSRNLLPSHDALVPLCLALNVIPGNAN